MYQTCPVCNGKGLVSAGFYRLKSRLVAGEPETCRTCIGTGMVGCPDLLPHQPYQWPPLDYYTGTDTETVTVANA